MVLKIGSAAETPLRNAHRARRICFETQRQDNRGLGRRYNSPSGSGGFFDSMLTQCLRRFWFSMIYTYFEI